MATTTAVEIARTFGRPNVTIKSKPASGATASPWTGTTIAHPGAAIYTGGYGNNPMAGPLSAASVAGAPPVQGPPTMDTRAQTAGGQPPQVTGGPVQPPAAAPPAPSPYAGTPSYARPTYQAPRITGTGEFRASGSSSRFQSPAGVSGGIAADPALTAMLKERAATGGMMGLEEFLSSTTDPLVAMMERDFGRAVDHTYGSLAERGVVDSGETVEDISHLSADLAERSAAVRGQYGAMYEQMKQGNINAALGELGDLESALIGSKTAITTANISAAAQVQSASIQAGATVSAAQIHANASLQAAGMNHDIAIKRLDQEYVMNGIDPVRFESDPIYRGNTIDFFAMKELAKMNLQNAQTWNLINSGLEP